MTPEVRAFADRFTYEQATLKHMMALVPEGGFERPIDGMDWSVRQLFGHLAQSLTAYSAAIHTWLAGGDPLAKWDPDRSNAESAMRFEAISPDEIAALFGTGLNGLVASMAEVPDGRAVDFGPTTFVEALGDWVEHFLSHAVPLVQALPELRMDPLVLNWLLYAEFDDDELCDWQDELTTEAREYIATLTFEDEGDEE